MVLKNISYISIDLWFGVCFAGFCCKWNVFMELLRLTQAQVANQGGETSVAEILSSFYSQDSVSSFLLILVTIMIVLPVLF